MKENDLDEDQVEFLQKVARAITACREVRCLTRNQVAKLVGIPHSSYARIERGECNVRVADLYAIARALEVTTDNLIPY